MTRKEKIIMNIPRAMDATALGLLHMMRFIARFVPPRLLIFAVDFFGGALYLVLRGRREYLLRTLREALPDSSDEGELKLIARKAFGAPLKAILDSLLMERYGDRIMDNLVMAEGTFARFDEAVAAGKGLILFSPHLGGIGIITAILNRAGRPFTPLVMSPDRTPFPRFITCMCDLGESLGCDKNNPVFWAGKQTIPKVRKHLEDGGSVGITFDMLGGTVMDFFGQPTAVGSGIAHFACDSGAPILSYCLRRGEDPLSYELVYFGEVAYELTGDRSRDVHDILEAVIGKGEEIIRYAPDQWIIWFSLRNWRRRARKIIEESKQG